MINRNRNTNETYKMWKEYYSSVKNDSEFYNEEFKKYTFIHSWHNSIRSLERLEPIKKGMDILDAGCGWGRMLLGIVDKYSALNISAMDYQQESLDTGMQLFKNESNGNIIKWIKGDITSMPFKNDSFDIVYSMRVFQHLNSPSNAASEMIRVLKPGGKFLILVQNKLCPLNLNYYSRKYTPREVKSFFSDLTNIEIHYSSIDFFRPIIRRTHHKPNKFAMTIERIFEKIPFLNMFGGKVVVWGKKNI
jgi:ubiquinone/menaquinone biosynthesis C-methylase UbiE